LKSSVNGAVKLPLDAIINIVVVQFQNKQAETAALGGNFRLCLIHYKALCVRLPHVTSESNSAKSTGRQFGKNNLARDMAERNLYSIPNILSLTRLALVPVLVVLAYFAEPEGFLVVLAVSLLSDVFDGYLARKLNLVSELGAKLDSWADMLTYGCMILGIYWIWPQIFAQQLWFLVAATLSFILPVLYAFNKFGEYPSYHTLGAKTAAVLMAPAFYLLTLMGADLFFNAVIIFHIIVAFEELAITSVLTQPRSNVRSIFSLVGNSKLAK